MFLNPLFSGHYAHSIGEVELAISLFLHVLNSDATHLHRLATVSAALSELQRRDGEDAVDAALGHLGDLGMADATALHTLPTHERAAAQLVNGIVLCRRDDPTGARLLLTKALKQAHGLIGSTQLVGQVRLHQKHPLCRPPEVDSSSF